MSQPAENRAAVPAPAAPAVPAPAVPAPAVPAPTVPAPVDPAEAAAVIADARARIDELDGRILDLIEQRRALSERVQAARIGSGGTRLALTREMEVLERYRARLGRPGTDLGMLLLELCRGRA